MSSLMWFLWSLAGMVAAYYLGRDVGYRRGRHDEFYDHYPEMKRK